MADAPALGAGARKGVEVQILSPTPRRDCGPPPGPSPASGEGNTTARLRAPTLSLPSKWGGEKFCSDPLADTTARLRVSTLALAGKWGGKVLDLHGLDVVGGLETEDPRQ